MAHDENKAFLRRMPIFTGIGESQLEMLAAGSVRRSFPRGRSIVAEGETSQSFYLLLSGRAKVQRSDSEGKEVILATIEPCDFIAVNKESFKAMLASSTDMCMAIMRGIVRRLREADKKIETLALMDVYGRVARVLLDFSETVGGERVVKGKLPRQEIAKMIGASREMVSRVMKGLEVDGFIVPVSEGRLLLRDKINLYLN